MIQFLGGEGQGLVNANNNNKLPREVSYNYKCIVFPISNITSNKNQNEVTLRILCTY